jgi:hypothetical protein
MALEKEFATFQQELPKLLAEPGNEGHFALIHGDEVAGVYPSFDAALSVGYDRYGLDPFLVQEVTDRVQPQYFSRNLKCRT